jgi:hypothetical protein
MPMCLLRLMKHFILIFQRIVEYNIIFNSEVTEKNRKISTISTIFKAEYVDL